VVGEGIRAPLYRAVDVRDHAAATSSSTVVAVEGVGLLASRAENVNKEKQEYLAAVSRARVIDSMSFGARSRANVCAVERGWAFVVGAGIRAPLIGQLTFATTPPQRAPPRSPRWKASGFRAAFLLRGPRTSTAQ
jgi:hypothetical protein